MNEGGGSEWHLGNIARSASLGKAEGRFSWRLPAIALGWQTPEFVAYWDTKDEDVQGVWVGKAGGWIVCLRAQYPPNLANDSEAGQVAQILFAEVVKQVR